MPKVDKNTDAQQIRDEIKTIGTVLTWLLGFLALIIAGMVSFVFQGLTPLVAEYNFPTLNHAVVFLLTVYLTTAGTTLSGLAVSFVYSGYTNTAEELANNLKALKKILTLNIGITIFSLVAILGFVVYFVYY